MGKTHLQRVSETEQRGVQGIVVAACLQSVGHAHSFTLALKLS